MVYHLCSGFRDILNITCNKKNHDGLLLSGGLDSSILAYHLKPKNAITITVDNRNNSQDYFYSTLIAEKKYVTEHHKIIISFEEILAKIEELIKDYKAFDPIFLKNSVIQLIGFHWAQKLKIKSLVVGDGADELFAGYNFLHKYMEDRKKITEKIDFIIENMNFFSTQFSLKTGYSIFLPFLESEIVQFSKKITLEEKISNHDDGTTFGKFFLRKCYEDILGKEIAWRKKTALQDGSGVYKLEKHIEKNILNDDKKYNEEIKKIKLNEHVIIRNKEHLYFYKIYRKFFNPPVDEEFIKFGKDDTIIKKCQYCNSWFIWQGNFCKVCGSFPAL